MSDMTEIAETAQDAVKKVVESKERGAENLGWHKQVALTTLIMALLTAVGGMLASICAHSALVERTIEIVKMNTLEGDRDKLEILKSKHDILAALGETPDPAEIEVVATFEREMRELEANSAREEALGHSIGNTHVIFAIAVTLLSMGISLGGMAVVIERKWLWATGLVVGTAGILGVGIGIVAMLS